VSLESPTEARGNHRERLKLPFNHGLCNKEQPQRAQWEPKGFLTKIST
jgi:hypothetical protein